MKEFLGEDFLLSNKVSDHLYHDYASHLPIIDYHCHLSPREIYEDKPYENITQMWLYGDHYKWRLMRANGVKEELITGQGTDYDKFMAYAFTMERAIGNPLYHWSHMELKNYFGITSSLTAQSAPDIWNETRKQCQDKKISPRTLIRQSRVEVLCTTDDPVDDLRYHKLLSEENFATKVFPTFRPDRAMNIRGLDYVDYLKQLSLVAEVPITSFANLMEALEQRMIYFISMGCKLCDHGMERVVYRKCDANKIEEIFQKVLMGKEEPTKEEAEIFQSAFLIAMGRLAKKYHVVMQLHFGVARNINTKMYQTLGADIGGDAIADAVSASELGTFLNALNETNELPKVILYSLNPADNAMIETVMGSFYDASARGKLAHGSAWWFNDHKIGMQQMMTSLANLGLLGNFIGMLTDSRSFLSYARHEYFRRILCDLIGTWVECGEFPQDEALLKQLIYHISYGNAKEYFDF